MYSLSSTAYPRRFAPAAAVTVIDRRLATLFAPPEHMLQVLGDDPTLREFRRGPEGGAKELTALLMAERIEKKVMGIELVGDMLRRDVAQVAVSFSGH